MAKRHARPSSQYRYEHYDPRVEETLYGAADPQNVSRLLAT